jgi:hypothetical protein
VTGVVTPLTVLVAVVTTAWPVPSTWVRAEVTGAVMLATVPPGEVPVPSPVAASWVTAVVTGAVTPETEPLTEDVTALAVDATCATAEETGAVTGAAVSVTEELRALPAEATWLPAEDVRALPAEATWLPAEDTEPVTEEAELATAEVADWPADVTWLTADFAVPAVLGVAPPAACVAADTADVVDEAGAALAGAVGLAAGALEAGTELVTVETAAWPVEAACPTADDTSAAAEEALVSVAPAVPLSAVVAPGLADADADFAVRRENTMATPIAAMAMPAANRQNRRTLVTSPLVTTVTLIGPGYFCLAHLCLN